MSEKEMTMIEILLEMKDTSELMVSLAYSALLYHNREIANEVLLLENEMDEMYRSLKMKAVSSAQGDDGVEKSLVFLQMAESMEEIAWEIKKEVEKNVDSLQLILWDAVEFKGAYFQRFVDQHESLLNVVMDAIGKKLQSRGYFKNVDPRVAIYVILNTFFDMFGRRTLFGIEVIEGMNDEELVKQVSELFTKGVFGI